MLFQALCKDQRVHAVRIVARHCFDHMIPVLLVERDCGRIVDCSFEVNNPAAECAQALLCNLEQRGSGPVFARVGEHVDGDDVADPLAAHVRNKKTDDLPGAVLGNQGNGVPAAYINAEFVPAVCDSRSKTELVDFPKLLKIFG